MWCRGDRVYARGKPGRVNYVILRAPDYTQPSAVAVLLDSERERPQYAGTIFSADEVSDEPPLRVLRGAS